MLPSLHGGTTLLGAQVPTGRSGPVPVHSVAASCQPAVAVPSPSVPGAHWPWQHKGKSVQALEFWSTRVHRRKSATTFVDPVERKLTSVYTERQLLLCFSYSSCFNKQQDYYTYLSLIEILPTTPKCNRGVARSLAATKDVDYATLKIVC